MSTYIFNGLFILLFGTTIIAFFVLLFFQARAMLVVLQASRLRETMFAFLKGDLDADLRRKWGKAIMWWAISFGALIATLFLAQAFDALLV